MSDLLHKASTLPTSPGVYLFKDRRDKVLYVGKAVNLRARVRQYLSGTDERFMVPYLVRAATDVEVVVVSSEKEALLLENTLIKRHQPRYNVKLTDDKNFLHLRIDPRDPWPRYTLVRRIGDDKARTFGPYHSATMARQTQSLLARSFPLRTCTDAVLASRRRPCILHQMGRCVAPCVGLVTAEAYRELVEESMLFLEGRARPLITRLRARMARAADAEHYEEAARVRDLISSVEQTLEQQKVVDTSLADRDVWGLHRDGAHGALAVIPVREGMMGSPRVTPLRGLVGDDEEILSSLLNEAYPPTSFVPPEILVPRLPRDAEALTEVLSERRGAKVALREPQRGQKVRLVELAAENARVHYVRQEDEGIRRERALVALAEALELPGAPRRIECFDNSNLQGEHPVAAMSVFIDGRPDRSQYRRYRVKTVVGADDFATMREILHRRMTRAIAEDTRPDLLVVDGGKGQLAVAVAVLADLGLRDQAVCGISKPRTEHARGERDAPDKIVLPNRKEPLKLRPDHPGLRLLQHLRDEVHAHAVRYHRKRRQRSGLQSVLEALPGVGPSRRKALLAHLGSARAVVEATEAELSAVPGVGPALAARIRAALDEARG